MSTRIGIDVGGTFTDLIFFDEETGAVTVGKGPSNPEAVDQAVRGVLAANIGADATARARYFMHGTTVGLNALLERKGAKVGLLTNAGFRDVLDIRRLLRVDESGEHMWNNLFRTPEPLVERPLRIGVGGRIKADGIQEVPLDEAAVRAAAETFAGEGVDSVAVVFINSHANSAHEITAEKVLRDGGFTGPISLSHAVSGQYREYERASTTVVDAYVRPAVSGYLERLESGLQAENFDGECLITTSSGGSVAFGDARRRPFETIMSGPVAGAVGASKLCSELGLRLAITADVGGTSFDTCLLVDGQPRVRNEGEVVGMPLQMPWVDVRSVGAGGGSIASVDRGLLRVGPESAGALPGPVCYGRGGTDATVTDAAVALGMLARETLASGLRLDIEGARAAVGRVGAEMGMDAQAAARGILRVVAAHMAGAIRAVSIEVGEDPREAALIGYGGAGPLFVSLLARELDIRTIIIPNYAGNFSAWGLLEQDLVRSAALTIVSQLDGAGIAKAEVTLDQLFRQIDARAASGALGTTSRSAEFDLRYPGQEYTLTLPVPLQAGEVAETPERIAARFAENYERNYGHRFELDVELLTVRAIERTVLPRTGRPRLATPGSADRSPDVTRAFSFARNDWCDFAVVDREALAPGDRLPSPAIIMEATTTSYIDAGLDGRVHDSGALVFSQSAG
jgi:N-methylhydantoinase A